MSSFFATLSNRETKIAGSSFYSKTTLNRTSDASVTSMLGWFGANGSSVSLSRMSLIKLRGALLHSSVHRHSSDDWGEISTCANVAKLGWIKRGTANISKRDVDGIDLSVTGFLPVISSAWGPGWLPAALILILRKFSWETLNLNLVALMEILRWTNRLNEDFNHELILFLVEHHFGRPLTHPFFESPCLWELGICQIIRQTESG